MGEIIAQVAHVEHDGDLILEQVVDREQPFIVDVEPLGVRVHLDAVQSLVQDPLGFLHQPLHLRV